MRPRYMPPKLPLVAEHVPVSVPDHWVTWAGKDRGEPRPPPIEAKDLAAMQRSRERQVVDRLVGRTIASAIVDTTCNGETEIVEVELDDGTVVHFGVSRSHGGDIDLPAPVIRLK